jgi:RHS repeat-associated protein
VTTSGEISDNPFQYTGRENDGTGLYYYRARYYSPELQRWISEDPIGFEGGDVNLYAYVKNDPADLVDPTGEKAKCYTGKQLDGLPISIKEKIPPGLINAAKKPCWKMKCFECCTGVLVDGLQLFGLCVECKFP